ncbi:hypothetical protein [Ktedonospora formicarum]|uniref:hypothetical protein n=1 Tax=Ktedonospora formicarum TaxID=2778364 RepID=UPI001C68CCBA|nr:hypothetical protein [Ktedonospora formicarum]
MATHASKQTDISAKASNRAATPLKQVLQQTRYELLLTSRRGENVLVTLIIPIMLLIFFASLNIVPGISGSAVNFLLPGILGSRLSRQEWSIWGSRQPMSVITEC